GPQVRAKLNCQPLGEASVAVGPACASSPGEAGPDATRRSNVAGPSPPAGASGQPTRPPAAPPPPAPPPPRPRPAPPGQRPRATHPRTLLTVQPDRPLRAAPSVHLVIIEASSGQGAELAAAVAGAPCRGAPSGYPSCWAPTRAGRPP